MSDIYQYVYDRCVMAKLYTYQGLYLINIIPIGRGGGSANRLFKIKWEKGDLQKDNGYQLLINIMGGGNSIINQSPDMFVLYLTFKGSFLVYFWFLKILRLDLESKWPLFEGTFSITLISSQPFFKDNQGGSSTT